MMAGLNSGIPYNPLTGYVPIILSTLPTIRFSYAQGQRLYIRPKSSIVYDKVRNIRKT